MGCGTSKNSNAAAAVTTPEKASLPEKPKKSTAVNERPPSTSSVNKKLTDNSVNSKRTPTNGLRADNNALSGKRPESGTTVVSSSGVGLRNSSAASGRSTDSGIGSEPTVNNGYLRKEEDSAQPSKITPRERKSEKAIVDSLREDGLLLRPKTASAGLTYEVPLNELKVRVRRPPPRLEKLDRNNKMNYSKEQIREKLAKAENIRKTREREKIQKNREKDTRNLEVKLALLEFEKKKEKDMGQKLDSSINLATAKRGKFLENVVEKQKQESKKVEEAKHRKLENSMNLPKEEYDEMMASKTKFNASSMSFDDMPVGPSA